VNLIFERSFLVLRFIAGFFGFILVGLLTLFPGLHIPMQIGALLTVLLMVFGASLVLYAFTGKFKMLPWKHWSKK
jgi:hypothetical protein